MPVEPEKQPQPLRKPRPPTYSNTSNWWLLVVLAVVLAFVYYSNNHGDRSKITYGMFRHQLEVEKNIESVDIQGANVYGPTPNTENLGRFR